ncbi:translational GTPase TypA [Oceanispirochaeta crateris]|uniref:Large ribosomal subunit assembly factor BipA n=1 Tax=Oceanispirochaeta crateris TaxID=2518645 RepID=A0A5C1QP30_9SPIO|nr:translational GTPase TypA [Oceanispirochaeta crateris]QEN08750.1 translational GTPase TypA [Oceanispirochaeta crateris]
MPHNNNSFNKELRNIAIIAHVDHGKTTLVDSMFKQSGTFREGKETEERLMDSMDLERERGITIAAKNCSIVWKGVKINILDTPGHADFGGEVERALSMVDGVLLLVDASEGPLPQTRFVLAKALNAGLSVVIVINKIDRPDARPEAVLSEVYDLLIDLDAHDDQLECPVLFADGRAGIAKLNLEDKTENLHVLMDTILKEIPPPSYNDAEPFQMLVTDLSYSDYLGRLAIGKVVHGHVKSRDALVCIKDKGKQASLNVTKLQVYEGPSLKETDSASPGDIVVMAGIEDVHIGDTICTKVNPKALKRITVDEPTVSMRFTPNTSPTMGQEGKFVQSSKIRERLEKETMLNVSIKVEEFPDKEGFVVKGRGEFQMVILIETMRREGFELCVGRPEVIFHHKDGKVMEPIEHLYVDCEEEYTGVVTEKLSKRKGRMVSYVNHEHGRVRLEFSVPSRALIGYRDEFLTDTRGTGIMNSLISDYEEYRGDFPDRHSGALIADRTGEAVPYALYNLEPRGQLFVSPGDVVYEGMIVGEHNRENDLNVNACKTKKLSNVRASGKDDAVVLTPVIPMTLERGIQFLREDELMEVTPKSIRLRKVLLAASARKVNDKKG